MASRKPFTEKVSKSRSFQYDSRQTIFRGARTAKAYRITFGPGRPSAQILMQARRASALDRLTAREGEVLHWVACGKTDRQVGAILGISVRTVQKHLQSVYPKLGVESRTAAALRARRP
jgi:DNA-binding NarL/FixJ family response regulator